MGYIARMRIFFNRWQAVSAPDVLGGVFIAQRNLLESIRSHVLAGSGLTPEIAEILIELFLAGGHLSSPEHADVDGYVPVRDLCAALGYSAGLLSRRIGWLCQRHWAETKRAVPSVADGLHGNCQKVGITELGKGKIAPVWQRYDKLAERLLAGFSPADLAAHYRINEIISDKLRAPRFLADDSETADESSPPIVRPARVSARKPNTPAAAREPVPTPKPVPKNLFLEPGKEFLD
jgi:DNA-binding MarR family transcriptional regulator